jgi:hypothetical protein
VHRHGGYRFTILLNQTPNAPPATNPLLGEADEALLAAFQTHLAEMTVAMQNGEYFNGSTPAPPSGEEDQGYLRIVGDYSVDSDRDGSPDWLEFLVAANPSHPGYALANAFLADTNQDGTPDGEQIDSDEDGIVDSDDPADGDVVIDWVLLPEPRYAAFPFLGPEESSGGIEQRPLCRTKMDRSSGIRIVT